MMPYRTARYGKAVTVDVHVERVVDAPATRVWEVVTDLDSAPAVISGIDHVERLDDATSFGVGTTWRETRTMFGKQVTEQMEVTQVDPPHRYTVVAINGSTTYTSVVAVTPIDEHRCHLTMTMAARSSSLVTRLLAATLGRLFLRATRSALQRDVDDIAACSTDRPTPGIA